MSKQSQGSLILVGALAGGFGFVAFVALMLVGDFRFSPALFLALVVAAAAAVFLFVGFHRTNEQPLSGVREEAALRASRDGRLGDRTVKAGTAGVEPGSAGRAPGHSRTGADEHEGVSGPATESWRHAAAGATPGEVTDVENAHADQFGSTPFSDPHPREETSSAPRRDAESTGEISERDAQPGTTPVNSEVTPTKDDAGKGAESETETRPAEDATPEREQGSDIERTVIGTEPPRLDGPREGGPDDLKKIKGIGPKLEETLNRWGFYHYDQIADWSDQEIAWADERIEGIPGRASRDDWRAQARELRDGGTSQEAKGNRA